MAIIPYAITLLNLHVKQRHSSEITRSIEHAVSIMLGMVQVCGLPSTDSPVAGDRSRQRCRLEHHAAERRRRIGRSLRCLPPNLARRRALSNEMRASRPRQTSEVFSVIPVSCLALFRRSSSILRIVLICISMHHVCIRFHTLLGRTRHRLSFAKYSDRLGLRQTSTHSQGGSTIAFVCTGTTCRAFSGIASLRPWVTIFCEHRWIAATQ